MSRERQLLEGAEEWLAAAKSEITSRRYHVAFEAGRHAAELAAKALLVNATGEHPKTHAVAAPLVKLGLLPPGIDGRALHRVLAEFTLGTYGVGADIPEGEVRACIDVAERLVTAVRAKLSPG